MCVALLQLVLACLMLSGLPISAYGAIHTQLPAMQIDVQNGPAQLEKAIRQKLKEIGDDPYTLNELANVLYDQGHNKEAKKLWNQAAASEPNLPSAHLQIFHRLVQRRELEPAEAVLLRAQTDNPEDPHVLLATGELAMRRGEYEAASKAFVKALSLGPQLPATNLALGRYHEFKNNHVEAKRLYLHSTELTPKRPDGWLLLAANDFKRGDTQQAFHWFQKAEKINSFQPLAEARLAELYLSIRDYVGAYRWYRKAIIRKPKDDQVQVRLGQMQLVLKMRDQAREQFQVVLNRNEFLPALVALGQLEETDGNLDVSAELYRRVLQQDANNIIANNNLAMLLVQMSTIQKVKNPIDSGETDGEQRDDLRSEALKLAQNANRLQPGNPTILSTYGCALFVAGDAKAAVNLLAKAIRANSSDPWTRYFYGKSLLATGQNSQASEQLESCLILDPNFSQKEEIRKILQD